MPNNTTFFRRLWKWLFFFALWYYVSIVISIFISDVFNALGFCSNHGSLVDFTTAYCGNSFAGEVALFLLKLPLFLIIGPALIMGITAYAIFNVVLLCILLLGIIGMIIKFIARRLANKDKKLPE